ncbi:MAG: L,D-transpeptidase [Hyphomicrobiales bacterium]
MRRSIIALIASAFGLGVFAAPDVGAGTRFNFTVDTGQGATFTRRYSGKREVKYKTKHRKGTIIIDTGARKLYLVLGEGKALRYGVGVGRRGYEWSGRSRISRKAEWPGWTPPPEMRKREPHLPEYMPGGPNNPLGARALYLGASLYRIHGTNARHTIGRAMSSGCIRMMNADVIDLYKRVKVGTLVVVTD